VSQLAAEVTEEMRRWKASVLLTHGVNGEYGHPAHKICYQAALAAVMQMAAAERDGGEPAPLLYTVQGTFPGHPHPRLANVDSPAHLVLDITPYLPAKTEAALCHRTQHALFVRRPSEEAGRQMTVEEVVMHLESLQRVHPPVEKSPPHDALADLLWASGCASLPVMG
jgi:LmbE family N-acetylglucosaminyl deacetylase